ncbi:MAG: FKBP-type peptidyl-prolyl cis-trans isomerase [Bacteroidaceae bacterium]|nr:FKBP-type peptidyl-prolyl cis-trans isomerase [Bacteroidaceae bacterium]
MAENRFISLSYDLFIKGDDGEPSLYERAPKEKPFQFISGVGYTLDLFEKNVINLKPKDSFEFEIPCSEAYGEYDEGSVLELQKSIFTRDGKFDSEHVREGYIIPLSDGEQTFNAIVQQIREDVVVVDLNHPLAGEDLRFKGQVIENRPATEKEIEAILNPKGCQGHCGNCKEGCSSEKCDKEGGDCECGCKQS